MLVETVDQNAVVQMLHLGFCPQAAVTISLFIFMQSVLGLSSCCCAGFGFFNPKTEQESQFKGMNFLISLSGRQLEKLFNTKIAVTSAYEREVWYAFQGTLTSCF